MLYIYIYMQLCMLSIIIGFLKTPMGSYIGPCGVPPVYSPN